MRRRLRTLVGARWVITLGHYSLWPVLGLASAERIVGMVTGSYPAILLVSAIMTPFALAIAAHACGVCIRGVCGQLGGTEEDAEDNWWLWWSHHVTRSRITWILLGTWTVFTFILPVPLLTIPPSIVMVWGVLRAMQIHSRLRPWCQWCNERGDDGDDSGDVPDPDGGLSIVSPRETAWYSREDWA